MGTVGQGDSLVERVKLLKQELAVGLKILVWGPGRRALSHWYDKRIAIVDELRGESARFEVLTSEDIFDQETPDEHILLEAGKLELLHASEAHLIFALIIGHPHEQGGVYRELDLISTFRSLREKTWIFLPDQKSYLRDFTSGSLRNFRQSHLIALPWDVIKDCHQIRQICKDKAQEEIHQMTLDRLHVVVGGISER